MSDDALERVRKFYEEKRARRVEQLKAAQPGPKDKRFALECIHRGNETGEVVPCGSCGGKKNPTPVYACAVKGKCTTTFANNEIQFCRTCPDRAAPV
jgi:hypothetical protein